MNLIQRPRRLRNGSVLRNMVRETRISADTLIYPMFVIEGTNIKEEIATMPGQYRWSIDRMDEILQEFTDAGVKSVLLFGIPKKKDEIGSSAGRRWHCAAGNSPHQTAVSTTLCHHGCLYV